MLFRRIAAAAILVLGCSSLFALDRGAITFTKYDLKATVAPDQQVLDVVGTVTVRNDSAIPQPQIALQLSSSLSWKQISIGDEDPSWLTHPYTSDIDHTGALTEAVVTLDKPLPPKASVILTVHYGGTIVRDGTRLTRIGVPETAAAKSEWDRISPDFTALRGVGYVTWYPVSIEAASFSTGGEPFNSIEAWKRREHDATIHIDLSIRQEQGTVAPAIVSNASESSVTNFTFSGDLTPVFVIGDLRPTDREHLTIFATAEHTSIARDYVIAAEKSLNTLKDWFGVPTQKAVFVELTDSDALPFEVGRYLFTPVKPAPPLALEVALTRTLVHAAFDSPRPWIREGLAMFAQALVREQQQGRRAGLMYLNSFVNVLAAAEKQSQSTMSAGESSSKQTLPSTGPQPLTQTSDDVFYRTKAGFVWWMLRDMLGDDAIRTFIARYRPADDKDPSYAQRLLENAGSSRRDLEQFFDDWIYRDRGLPEFRIDSAYPRELIRTSPESKPNFVVAVTVENTGGAGAEVPVVVRAGKDEHSVRLMVEAHSKAVARVPFPGVPEEVIVNDGSVPEADISNNRIFLHTSSSK